MTTLQDFGLAYRKAKVDLYYSSHVSLDAIADYEEALHANLSELLAKLQSDDESWVKQPEFFGRWTLATKSVDMSCWERSREQNGNDRQYGDSRIRAPAKDSWNRDVLRIKGGVTDYCVIGEIDVQTLRQFQSSHRSPAKPFKPVPDGFEIDFGRKALPTREK